MLSDPSASTPHPDRLFNPRDVYGFVIDPSIVGVDRSGLDHVGCEDFLHCNACVTL
jgi:hypothetical protein